MKAGLYDKVLELSVSIVNSSEREDTRGYWKAYNKLKYLCESNSGKEFDHPLQWEALADFTADFSSSVVNYELALQCAERLVLKEYSASISLALASRYWEAGERESAIVYANKAYEFANEINNNELLEEINEFIGMARGST